MEFLSNNPIESLVDLEEETEELKMNHYIAHTGNDQQAGSLYYLEFDQRLKDKFGRISPSNIFQHVQNQKYDHFIRVISHSDRWKRMRVFMSYGSGVKDSFSSDIGKNRSKGDK